MSSTELSHHAAFANGVKIHYVRGGVIEGCAHWIAEEQPEALTLELLAFFGEE